FQRKAVALQMVNAALLADDRNRPVAKVDKDVAKCFRVGGAVADGYLYFFARLGLRVDPGAFVGHEVLLANAAEAKRFIGFREIAVGGVEIMIGLLKRR